jgi:transposase
LDSSPPIAPCKGRQAEDGIAWCTSRPQAERDLVDVGVLDMSKTFFSAIKAIVGDHVPGIDRFQVVQQAVRALEEVLRSVLKQLDPEEAKARKQLRKRGLKSADPLQGDELIARSEWRRRFPQ